MLVSFCFNVWALIARRTTYQAQSLKTAIEI